MNFHITLKRGFLIYILGCLFFYSGNLRSQSPYKLNPSKEVIWLSSGISVLASGYLVVRTTTPFTSDEILVLDRQNINSFDRFASKNYSTKFQNASDIFLLSSFGSGVPFLFKKQIRKDFFTLGIIYFEAATITTGTTLLTKALTKRSRPFVFNGEVGIEEKISRGAKYSFFSGHTSIAAMNTFFLAKIFSDYSPNSKWKPYVWTGAILIPAATGWGRVEGGKHFPTDVLAGYTVGALVGYFVPHFHKVRNQKETNIHIEPNPFGVSFFLDLK